MNQNELPVDQAVPIGTKLQLRARISTQSVWKFVKLMEVTVSLSIHSCLLVSWFDFFFFSFFVLAFFSHCQNIFHFFSQHISLPDINLCNVFYIQFKYLFQVSPDPDDPHAPGSVALVRDGCRNRDFSSIIPHQVRIKSLSTTYPSKDKNDVNFALLNLKKNLWLARQISWSIEWSVPRLWSIFTELHAWTKYTLDSFTSKSKILNYFQWHFPKLTLRLRRKNF